jgi:hypothetical protein
MAGYEPTAARERYDKETERLSAFLLADRIGWSVKQVADVVIGEQDTEISRLRAENARLRLQVPPVEGAPPA